jgi:hypothetical protein
MARRTPYASRSRADNPVEWDRLTSHLARSIAACGEEHGRMVAMGFEADFGWDADDLLRACRAQAPLDRP